MKSDRHAADRKPASTPRSEMERRFMHRDTALHRVAGGGDLTESARHPDDRDREVERRFEHGNGAPR